MQSMFRKVILASTVGVAATLAANTAMAANRVNVPFNFTVAGKTLPAGSYDVVHHPTRGFVSLESRTSSVNLTWPLVPGEPGPDDTKVVLRFDHSDEGEVLKSIQFGPLITPRLDNSNKRNASEREIRGQ